MLVVDLGVVHARAPRLVRVLVPGLVVDPAHVLVQGESDFREVGYYIGCDGTIFRV
jgi:hypothetical protein